MRFLWRGSSLTSSELYVSLETLLCFLQLSDRADDSRARCIGLFLLLVVLAPHDSNVVVYAQLLIVLHVVYAIVQHNK